MDERRPLRGTPVTEPSMDPIFEEVQLPIRDLMRILLDWAERAERQGYIEIDGKTTLFGADTQFQFRIHLPQ